MTLGVTRVAVTVFLVATAMLAAGPSTAHDSWLSGKRNKAGEWCCGEVDCFVVHARHVSLPVPGYQILETGEFVPEVESLPSMDGDYWRCQRQDGSRRCFFTPPEGF